MIELSIVIPLFNAIENVPQVERDVIGRPRLAALRRARR
jgi:hypothetical protein